MLNIDERFNIEKVTTDWQMMKLELFNVNIEEVENVIIEVYNDSFKCEKVCLKMYEDDNNLMVFFLLDNTIPKGEYLYNVVITFKSGQTINVISERGYMVND